ncbi:MAG: ABC transporter permease [Opitutaceae bacterium]
MSPSRLLRDSLRSLRRHRLRSASIMIGSVVGVAALTFVLDVGQGLRRKMLTTVQQIFGDSSVVVVAGGMQLVDGPRPDAARLTIDDIAAAAAAIPAVVDWDPQQVQISSVRRAGNTATARVLGQSERAEKVWARTVSRGRFFDAADVQRRERVALVGETLVRDLFGGADPLGAEIMVDAVPFTVVGVLERFGTDLHGMDRDNEIVVPVSTLMRRLANVDTISVAKLLISDPAQNATAAAQIREELRTRHALLQGQPDDFTLLTPTEVRQLLGKMQRIVTVYLPLASVVVLLVAGLIAATLMAGAVNARVAEIGVRRAIGACPADIARQFVAESAFTMLGGGLLGILLGSAAAQLLARRLDLGAVLSLRVALLGLALALVTGLLAGVVPALRAARLRPVDALR